MAYDSSDDRRSGTDGGLLESTPPQPGELLGGALLLDVEGVALDIEEQRQRPADAIDTPALSESLQEVLLAVATIGRPVQPARLSAMVPLFGWDRLTGLLEELAVFGLVARTGARFYHATPHGVALADALLKGGGVLLHAAPREPGPPAGGGVLLDNEGAAFAAHEQH